MTNAAKAICRGFDFLLGGGGDKKKASSEWLTVETLSIKNELLSFLNSNKPGKESSLKFQNCNDHHER